MKKLVTFFKFETTFMTQFDSLIIFWLCARESRNWN